MKFWTITLNDAPGIPGGNYFVQMLGDEIIRIDDKYRGCKCPIDGDIARAAKAEIDKLTEGNDSLKHFGRTAQIDE